MGNSFQQRPLAKGVLISGTGKAIIGDESRDLVTLYGDPEGLRYFARLLTWIADMDQRSLSDGELPKTEGFHTHLSPGHDCHPISVEIVIGRIDAKADGSTEWFFEGE